MGSVGNGVGAYGGEWGGDGVVAGMGRGGGGSGVWRGVGEGARVVGNGDARIGRRVVGSGDQINSLSPNVRNSILHANMAPRSPIIQQPSNAPNPNNNRSRARSLGPLPQDQSNSSTYDSRYHSQLTNLAYPPQQPQSQAPSHLMSIAALVPGGYSYGYPPQPQNQPSYHHQQQQQHQPYTPVPPQNPYTSHAAQNSYSPQNTVPPSLATPPASPPLQYLNQVAAARSPPPQSSYPFRMQHQHQEPPYGYGTYEPEGNPYGGNGSNYNLQYGGGGYQSQYGSNPGYQRVQEPRAYPTQYGAQIPSNAYANTNPVRSLPRPPAGFGYGLAYPPQPTPPPGPPVPPPRPPVTDSNSLSDTASASGREGGGTDTDDPWDIVDMYGDAGSKAGDESGREGLNGGTRERQARDVNEDRWGGVPYGSYGASAPSGMSAVAGWSTRGDAAGGSWGGSQLGVQQAPPVPPPRRGAVVGTSKSSWEASEEEGSETEDKRMEGDTSGREERSQSQTSSRSRSRSPSSQSRSRSVSPIPPPNATSTAQPSPVPNSPAPSRSPSPPPAPPPRDIARRFAPRPASQASAHSHVGGAVSTTSRPTSVVSSGKAQRPLSLAGLGAFGLGSLGGLGNLSLGFGSVGSERSSQGAGGTPSRPTSVVAAGGVGALYTNLLRPVVGPGAGSTGGTAHGREVKNETEKDDDSERQRGRRVSLVSEGGRGVSKERETDMEARCRAVSGDRERDASRRPPRPTSAASRASRASRASKTSRASRGTRSSSVKPDKGRKATRGSSDSEREDYSGDEDAITNGGHVGKGIGNGGLDVRAESRQSVGGYSFAHSDGGRGRREEENDSASRRDIDQARDDHGVIDVGRDSARERSRSRSRDRRVAPVETMGMTRPLSGAYDVAKGNSMETDDAEDDGEGDPLSASMVSTAAAASGPATTPLAPSVSSVQLSVSAGETGSVTLSVAASGVGSVGVTGGGGGIAVASPALSAYSFGSGVGTEREKEKEKDRERGRADKDVEDGGKRTRSRKRTSSKHPAKSSSGGGSGVKESGGTTGQLRKRGWMSSEPASGHRRERSAGPPKGHRRGDSKSSSGGAVSPSLNPSPVGRASSQGRVSATQRHSIVLMQGQTGQGGAELVPPEPPVRRRSKRQDTGGLDARSSDSPSPNGIQGQTQAQGLYTSRPSSASGLARGGSSGSSFAGMYAALERAGAAQTGAVTPYSGYGNKSPPTRPIDPRLYATATYSDPGRPMAKAASAGGLGGLDSLRSPTAAAAALEGMRSPTMPGTHLDALRSLGAIGSQAPPGMDSTPGARFSYFQQQQQPLYQQNPEFQPQYLSLPRTLDASSPPRMSYDTSYRGAASTGASVGAWSAPRPSLDRQDVRRSVYGGVGNTPVPLPRPNPLIDQARPTTPADLAHIFSFAGDVDKKRDRERDDEEGAWLPAAKARPATSQGNYEPLVHQRAATSPVTTGDNQTSLLQHRPSLSSPRYSTSPGRFSMSANRDVSGSAPQLTSQGYQPTNSTGVAQDGRKKNPFSRLLQFVGVRSRSKTMGSADSTSPTSADLQTSVPPAFSPSEQFSTTPSSGMNQMGSLGRKNTLNSGSNYNLYGPPASEPSNAARPVLGPRTMSDVYSAQVTVTAATLASDRETPPFPPHMRMTLADFHPSMTSRPALSQVPAYLIDPTAEAPRRSMDSDSSDASKWSFHAEEVNTKRYSLYAVASSAEKEKDDEAETKEASGGGTPAGDDMNDVEEEEGKAEPPEASQARPRSRAGQAWKNAWKRVSMMI
ncbi:hypothetical protein M427DRAFT_37914 [Gonapodya prolifera JEL478]|uniref:Uncharacterized protein n=1 Tax=Gonapodya prolifera (strain JEL478) TaxID=1344416 RepID=A0A139A0Q1_GONPJ|nr:hypothetical protein M427DRAFT_37914 [Gonapodya prolifera JEL478]|eukprot:KXS10115.1 hypothetical protein M427DRAFT_37914 [Gonapodya prolifera JEL478]